MRIGRRWLALGLLAISLVLGGCTGTGSGSGAPAGGSAAPAGSDAPVLPAY